MVNFPNILRETSERVAGLTDSIWVALISGASAIVIAVVNKWNRRSKERKELLDRIEDLEKDNRELHHEMESMKMVFRIVFNKYEQEWKTDPDKISMLKDLKEQFKI